MGLGPKTPQDIANDIMNESDESVGGLLRETEMFIDDEEAGYDDDYASELNFDD